MKRILQVGGFIAGLVLIAFGAVAIYMGASGRSTVTDNLKQEAIVGSPDMTPTAIKAEAAKAGLKDVVFPTCSVANKKVTDGASARCFASYMRIHALEATGGQTFANMPRYATADGKGTNDPTKATQANGAPVDNAARNIWVNETALSTALNVSYMADQLALFGVVVGIALLLTGIGLVILAGAALRPVREGEKAATAGTLATA